MIKNHYLWLLSILLYSPPGPLQSPCPWSSHILGEGKREKEEEDLVQGTWDFPSPPSNSSYFAFTQLLWGKISAGSCGIRGHMGPRGREINVLLGVGANKVDTKRKSWPLLALHHQKKEGRCHPSDWLSSGLRTLEELCPAVYEWDEQDQARTKAGILPVEEHQGFLHSHVSYGSCQQLTHARFPQIHRARGWLWATL